MKLEVGGQGQLQGPRTRLDTYDARIARIPAGGTLATFYILLYLEAIGFILVLDGEGRGVARDLGGEQGLEDLQVPLAGRERQSHLARPD